MFNLQLDVSMNRGAVYIDHVTAHKSPFLETESPVRRNAFEYKVYCCI
jgi:hypothetical protein